MEYVYSALVLHAAKKEINESNVAAVLKAAGVTPDDARVKALVGSLDGVDIEAAMKTAVMSGGGGGAAAPAAAAAAPEKEEEKGPTEEEAAAGLGALFG